EGTFPIVAVANVYARRPTVSRNLFTTACAINRCLMSDQRRIITERLHLLVGQSVTLDLAISAGVCLCRRCLIELARRTIADKLVRKKCAPELRVLRLPSLVCALFEPYECILCKCGQRRLFGPVSGVCLVLRCISVAGRKYERACRG